MEGQILTDIGAAYESATASWLGALLPIAHRLFLALATIELVWSGIWWALLQRQEEQVLVSILRKVVTISGLYTVLLFAPTWAPAVVGSFIRAGQVASGFDSLDPSTVVEQGIDLALGMYAQIGSIVELFRAPAWLFFAPLVVVLAFALIAGVLLVTLIESFLVLGGGVLLLGFAGSRWTVSFAEGYLLYAMRVGVKLFVLYLLIGIGMALPETWLAVLESGAPSDPRFCFEVMGGAVILAMIVWQVPQLAAAMLGPRASFHLERVYAS